MKKTWLILPVIGLLLLCAGCSSGSENSSDTVGDSYWDALDGFQGTAEEYAAKQGATTAAPDTAVKTTATPTGAGGFVLPADAVQLNLDKGDPSCDAMQFTYDSVGRISECRYSVNGTAAVIRYSYDYGTLLIQSTFGGKQVAEVESALDSVYSSEIGFRIYKGYYLKGYE